MKKLIALFLVIALFASLGVTAWAAEGGTPFADPMEPANRAMTVNVLWVMAGQPVVNYALGFEDVSADANYIDALRWAASEGIIKGYDAKTFAPADLVSREQLAVMLYRLAQKNGFGFTGAWMFPLNYADAGEVSEWANEAVHWMVMNGIMEAVDGKLLPAGQVTRRDMLHMTAAYICGAGSESVVGQQIRLGTSSYSVWVPDSYVTGELTEDEIADGAVAYYYSGFSDMDFDVYQFSKEGEPTALTDYAAKEAAEYGAVADLVEINGVSVALYYAVETYEGTDYTTLTAIADAGEDYVELVFWTEDLFTDYEAHSVLHTLTDVAGLLRGTWMMADKDGKSALTNDKYVINFVSDAKAYVSASFLKGGGHWVNLKEADVAISGNTMTLSSYPDEHTKVVDEFTITAINAGEFSADRKVAITANGTETLNVEAPVRFVKVDADYTDAILGSWEGRCTSADSVFDDGKEHRWSYFADGSYVYFVKDGDSWVPSTNTLNEYFVAGNLLCTRWVDNGVENREWWEITIDGDTMYWTALRRGDDGSTYTATFEMVRVSGAAADNAELVEQIKAFQTEHPEYKTAYHDILDQTDLILREELSTAFKAVQEEWKEKIMAQEEENGIPVEERQRFAGLCETRAFIINRDFTEHYKSVFVLDDPEYFDGSGETQVKITADYDEAYQAIAEQFSAFIAERGGDDGKAKELFNGINYSISREMDAAFDRANGRLKESIEDIAEAYGFSDEDKAFVSSVITGLMKDINANFMSIYTSNKMESFDPEIAIKK